MYRSHSQKRRLLSARNASPVIFVVLSLVFHAQRDAFALSLLALRDFHHSVGAGYNYSTSQSSSEGAGQTTQNMTCDYNAGFDYFILSPLLWKGSSSLDLEWVRDVATDSTGETNRSSLQLRYNIFGQVLPLSDIPSSFSTSSTRQTVSPSFTPSYQTDTDSFTWHLGIHNKIVPSTVSFSRQSQETSGLIINTRQTSNSITFAASHSLEPFGGLSLSTSFSQSDSTALETGVSGESRTGSVQAGYQGRWHSDDGLSRSLSLTGNMQQTAGTTSFDTKSLNGALQWQLGKNFDAQFTGVSSEISSSTHFSQSRGATAQLQQKLLGSLTTGVSLSAARDDFDDGNNSTYNAGVSLNYRKKLPESSVLNVGYSYIKGLNEHNGSASLIPVIEERHPIPSDLLRHIDLVHSTFDASTVVVTGAQSLLTYPASYYRFSGDGIDLTNTYPGDNEVLISYSYRRDPSVTTLSTSQSLSASVDLFSGKYRVYADAAKTDMDLVRGNATGLTLSGTRHYDLGATAKLQRHSLSAETGYDQHFANDSYYLASSWSYSAPYANGSLTLAVSDRWSQQSSNNGGGIWINSLTAQSNYQRQFRMVLGSFNASYANVLLPGGAMSHSCSAGANLETHFGKLSAVLNTNMNWNRSDAGWSAAENIGISIRRSF